MNRTRRIGLTLAALSLALGCQMIAGFEDFEAGDGSETGGSDTGGSGGSGGSSGTAGAPDSGGTGNSTSGGGTAGQPSTCAGGSWGEHPDLTMIQVEGADGHCFWMDETEVSREQYEAFLADHGDDPGQLPPCDWNPTLIPSCDWPVPPGAAGAGGAGGAGAGGAAGADPGLDPSWPVTCVDWCDAEAYCAWAGKRLCEGSYINSANPEQSEWYSVCSAGGQNEFPYSDLYDSTLCNGADNPNHAADPTLMSAASQTSCATPEGVINLSGNAAEWTNECNNSSGENDQCNVRGGSYVDTNTDLDCETKLAPSRDSSYAHIGFRCCDDAT